MQDCEKINNCLLCFNSTELLVSFGTTPLANELSDYHSYIEDDEFPLNLVICRKCRHVQLDHIVNPERLFRNYLYASGTSSVTHKYSKEYAESVINIFDLKEEDVVIDIGSNDGLLLSFFQKAGMTVVGFDPAENLAKIANENNILTISDFFTHKLAKQIIRNKEFTKLQPFEKAKVILSNNCFAHIKDLHDIVNGINELLDDDGVFIFENSYLGDVLDKNLFDTIYHEHLHTHSIFPLIHFFKKHGMKIFRVERTSNQGGSIRVFVCKNNSKRLVEDSVYDLLKEEEDIDDRLDAFLSNIEALKENLHEILEEHSDKNIDVFGLPAKSVTLFYVLNLDNIFRYIYEDAELKQNKFSPGFHLPILHSNKIKEHNPDVIFIACWNFADSVMQRLRKEGYKGKFIVPLPELKEYEYCEELDLEIERV